MTSRTLPRSPRARLAWLLALTAALLVVVSWQGSGGRAHAIAPPTVFTVVQTPAGPATVQPGDDVTYAINLTASADTAFLFIDGNLGPNLQVTSFIGGLGPTNCSGTGTSSFSCNIGSLGSGSSIVLITVHATVANAVDATVIDLAAAAFTARNGSEVGVPPATDNAGALTIDNESISITNTISPPSVFEGGQLTHTISLTNSGAGASGPYVISVAITNGIVINIVCPDSSAGTGNLTSTATCSSQPSLAAMGGAATMTIIARANDGTSATSMTNTVTLSPGLRISTAPPPPTATISQLTISTGTPSVSTGTPVTVCTTNSSGSPVLGATSGLNPLSPSDFGLVPGGGASATGIVPASSGCNPGESGVTFTSATAGTVTVTAHYNKTAPFEATSNTVTVTFTSSAPSNPVPTLNDVTPNTALAGSPTTTITVTGANFVASSVVRWGATDLATTYVDASHLSATIPANLLTTTGTTKITVFNPSPGGGSSLQQPDFTVNSGATRLAFTTQPAGAVANTALTTQPVVAVQNASSNTVTADSTTVVTLALVGGGGAAHLTCAGGTLSKTVTAGVATFVGCAVDAAGTGYTITASAISLTSATSSLFDVAAAPATPTPQLVVSAPAAGAKVARSRLVFSATTGTLSPAPTKVSFVIKRKSDNKYWDSAASAWGDSVVVNDAAAGSTPTDPWTLTIAGSARRLFVNTTVVVEARATSGTTNYVGQATPEIAIR